MPKAGSAPVDNCRNRDINTDKLEFTLTDKYSPYLQLFVFVALLEYAAVNFISRQEAGLLELLQKKRIARKKRQRQVRSRFITCIVKSKGRRST